MLAKKATPPCQRGELFAHLCGSDEDKCACFRDNHSAPIRPIVSNSRLGGSGTVAANMTMGAAVSSLVNVPNAVWIDEDVSFADFKGEVFAVFGKGRHLQRLDRALGARGLNPGRSLQRRFVEIVQHQRALAGVG